MPASYDLTPGTRIRTEDFYEFVVQQDGSLTDGDLTFDSINDLDVEWETVNRSDTPEIPQ